MSSRWMQCESGYLVNLDHCVTIRLEVDGVPEEGTSYSVVAGDSHILASRLSKDRAQEIMNYITYNVLHADIPT